MIIEKNEIRLRIEKLKKVLLLKKLDGAVIFHKPDLYYFSFTVQRGCLYVPSEGEPVLFVNRDLNRAREESVLKNIVYIKSFNKLSSELKKIGLVPPNKLGLEMDVLPSYIFVLVKSIFSPVDILDISTEIKYIRAIKSKYELDILRTASEKADMVLSKVTEMISPGMTEIELSGMIEAFARKLGHQGILRTRTWGSEIFYCSVLAGASAGKVTYLNSPNGGIGPNRSVANGSGFSKIRTNEPIFVDFAFVYAGYTVDVSRIFCIGYLDNALLEAHEVALDVQRKVVKNASDGVSCEEIYLLALEEVRKSKFKDNFMGFKNNSVKFIAHGVGLELDEMPVIARKQRLILKKNMVIALEPKMVFPSFGMVGTESVYRVTKRNLCPLTKLNDKIISA